MYEDLIKATRINYNNLLGTTEEDIKIHIIIPFLEGLGYKKDWFRFEYPTYKSEKRVDISILINKDPNNLLFVEVKRKDYSLNENSCVQLANYLNEKNIPWGILTNGNLFILFNNNVNGNSSEKEILRFYLFSPKNKDTHYSKQKNKNNLLYFSYKCIFKTKVTTYFKYLKDFKIKSTSEHSYKQYESVLYNFFNYLCMQEYEFDINNINPTIFKRYIKYILNNNENNTKRIKHLETLVNKYAYIRGFFTSIFEEKSIYNPFKNVSKEDILNDVTLLECKKNIYSTETLTNNEIHMILNSYSKSRNSKRNKLVFLLFLFCGLDIKEIQELKINDIDIPKNKINLKNRTIPLHKNLTNLIDDYIKDIKKQNIKCEYLFASKYNNSYNKFNNSTFNKIISKQFDSLNIDKQRKDVLTPSFIKWSLIKEMYKQDIPIQQISKFTGLSLCTINDYITNEDIANTKLDILQKKHPYKKIFDNLNSK